MKKVWLLIILIIWLSIHVPGQANFINQKNQNEMNPAKGGFDIFIVLDNSGSMKTNDPAFLTREVVCDFINRLGQNEENHFGMIIFASKAFLVQPLTGLTRTANRDAFLKSLEKVDYQGRWTNIPAAIERAIYELKTTGRKDTQKMIIFLTDGIVDTGNTTADLEKLKWLKDELAEECQHSGIHIFGIAFTDDADFSLIQSLALKTQGQYFRAFKVEDIPGIFERIENTLAETRITRNGKKPAGRIETDIDRPTTQPQLPAGNIEKENLEKENLEKETSRKLILPLPVLLGGGLLFILMVILFFIHKKKRTHRNWSPRGEFAIPGAILIDREEEFFKKPVVLNKPYLTIGRAPGTDITIARETVSAFHATIKYEKNSFFLEDQRSSNFTYLNGKKIAANQPICLKSRDQIRFDIYEFLFILPAVEDGGRTLIQKTSIGDGSKTMMREIFPAKELTENSAEKDETPAQTKSEGLSEGKSEAKTAGAVLGEEKQDVCPHHPTRKATDLCMGCLKGFCSECVTKLGREYLCPECAGKKKEEIHE